MEMRTLGRLVAKISARYPEWDCAVFPEGTMTYAELGDRTLALARALIGAGVAPRDHVGILLNNSTDFVAAFLGPPRAGAVTVPVNARFKELELAHVFKTADLHVLFTSDDSVQATDHAGLVAAVLAELPKQDPYSLRLASAPSLRQVVSFGRPRPGMLSAQDFLAQASKIGVETVAQREAAATEEDIAVMLYTSGTTSFPKGCMLSNLAFLTPAVEMAELRFFLKPGERMFGPLPLFHLGAITPMTACVAGGATFCGLARFDPDAAVEFLKRIRPTVAYPVWETLWLQIQRHPQFHDIDLSMLRDIHLVGVPERLREYQAAMPMTRLTSSYGTSEGAPATFTVPSDDEESRINTVGTPAPGVQVRVIDQESGRDTPIGVSGEIVYRGPMVFSGYYNDRDASSSMVDSEGWLHSGDHGRLREDGRLVYLGRLKDMLKVGGENVAAAEVENLLIQHPAVHVAYVVGAPDAFYVEVPAAYVELKQDASVTEAELIEFCKGRISTFKIPRYVRFVTEWPMSATKVQKVVLRQWIKQDLERLGIREAPRVSSR
jgi:fatty-acyl-CoA synthase